MNSCWPIFFNFNALTLRTHPKRYLQCGRVVNKQKSKDWKSGLMALGSRGWAKSRLKSCRGGVYGASLFAIERFREKFNFTLTRERTSGKGNNLERSVTLQSESDPICSFCACVAFVVRMSAEPYIQCIASTKQQFLVEFVILIAALWNEPQ